MNNDIMKQYIETLLINQNNTSNELLKDIFSKKDYLKLLRPVLKLIKDNPYDSMTTLRYKLFMASGLANITLDFVNKTKITPGVVIDFGTKLSRDTIICGNSQEIPYVKPINYDTIFDLASTSKLFTAISILKLHENKKIDVFDPVSKYVKEFKNLGNVSIYDLLKFRVNIKTDARVDAAKSKEEAEQILFTVHPNDFPNTHNAYTDMGAMVLKYVVERVSKMPFNEFVQEVIFRPTKMEDTHLNVPKEKIARVANENYSSIITSDGKEIKSNKTFPGTPHDPKAVVMGHIDGNAPGHAGYFSTTKDMIKLGEALIDEKILNKDSLYSISDSEVGFKEDEDNYSHFYGSLVYLKQPDPKNLSVYPPLSGRAFMSPGFAGTTLCVDPLNKITLFIGSNRLHNRIYRVHPNQVQNIKTDEKNKTRTFILPNGEEKIICSSYTHDKEVMVKLALDLALQFQLLETIMKPKKEMHLVREL